jgi:hypothetical protein
MKDYERTPTMEGSRLQPTLLNNSRKTDGRSLFRRAIAPKLVLWAMTVPLMAQMAFAQASYEEEDVVGYDTILKDLNREAARPIETQSRAKIQRPSRDPFENVWIHGGIGLSTMIETINFDDGQSAYANLKGIQASLGIDLFSENWFAEGSARSLDQDGVTNSTQIQLKEFDIKIMYKDRFSRHLGFRVGAGLTGRYLRVHRPMMEPVEYTTPSSIGSMGLDLYFSDRFSLGTEISARSALIAETVDRMAFDATFRIDTHF